MIITFNKAGTNQNVDNTAVVTSYSNTSKPVEAKRSDVSLGIADKVMDNEAYGSHGKTMEAVMQQAQLEDVAVQKNFMTVMSNSVSGEELKKMKEEGYSAGSTDIDTYVDIVDKIKVTLAQAGVVIAGYNDDLTQDKVASVTGSIGEAKALLESFSKHQITPTKENVHAAMNAIAQAMQLQELSDGMMQYMVNNQIEPTIENTYMAQFSATASTHQAQGYFSDGSGYYARKAQQYHWEQLSEQMTKICEEAGINSDNSEEWMAAMDNSRWLIEQGIPLTADNLEQISVLKSIDMPMTFEKLAELVASALENGKSPQEANLSGEENILEKAQKLVKEVCSITPEAVDKVVEEGKILNIKNLSAAQKNIIREQEEAGVKAEGGTLKATDDTLKAKRQLLEVQLMMTTQINRKLLKSGYQIETKDLQDLVNQLKNIENREQEIVFKGKSIEENVQKSNLFTETIDKVQAMASMPAAVIGHAIRTGEKFTINYVNSEGNLIKDKYQQAGESYEALMTSPRKDLGDSIQKAFQNIDDILKANDLDITEQNRRAVRILSYNQMEITKDNVISVKAADLAVQNVMKKMTPGATLQMIRDGINPLEKTIQEMDDYLTKENQGGEKQAEKYAEYLFKLEEKNDITQEERKAYIGIYRLFRQIEKSDGAVIGSLVAQQAELTMKNLLSAVRSGKARGMDRSVDDTLGTLQDVIQDENRISEQIMAGFSKSHQEQKGQTEEQRQQIDYYKSVCKSVFEELSPDKIADSGLLEETGLQRNLEEVAAEMTTFHEESSQAYFESVLEECKQMTQIDEYVIQTLIDYEQPVTMDNLLAANTIINKRGSLFHNLSDMAQEENGSFDTAQNYEDAVAHFAEHFTGKEEAKEAYEDLLQKAQRMIDSSIFQGKATGIDVKAASLLYKQLAYISHVAREENYEIPVNINGEATSVNLRIVHDTEEKGKISLTMQTEYYGQVGAEIEVTQDNIQGFIACQQKDRLTSSQELKTVLQEELSEEFEQKIQLQVITTNTLDIQKFSENKIVKEINQEEQENVSTSLLYRVSMKLLQSIGKVV